MPIFEYKARNKRGEMMQGRIESPNPQGVASWMLAAGLVPVHIRPHAADVEQPQWLLRLQGQDRLSEIDLLLFTRQMGALIKAGVPMLQALVSVQNSSTKPGVIKVMQALRSDLDKGMELSGAMAHHPKSFSDFYVSMVRVGEGSGQLELIFKRLFQQLEFDLEMKEKIKQAMRYPTFVIIAIAIALAILNVYVIPTFANIYASMKVSLPLLTKVLLGFSSFTVTYWWAVIGAIVLGIYAYRMYTSTPQGLYRVDKLKLKIPLVGKILSKAAIARFAFSFATASKSGVPIVQNFTLVARVVDNAFYEDRIMQMRDGVSRGESLARVAQSAGIFAPIELQMIGVGEDTGETDDMMEQVAEMYQREVGYEVGRLSAAIEPILIGAMGALVAILMLGIFMPLWDLGQMARHK
jgi:MSHA biogenesis protein MshG